MDQVRQAAPLRLPDVDEAGRRAHDAQRELPPDARELLRAGLLPALSAVDGPVLDVGIGAGAMAEQVLAPVVDRLVGVEPNPGMLSGLTLTRRAVQGSATTLPFADASVAGVHAAYVLHHVDPPEGWRAALTELVRVLAPGGSLALCLGPGVRDPLASAVTEALEAAQARLGLPAGAPQHRGSLRDPQQVTDLLTEAGLAAPFDVVARYQQQRSVREIAARQADNPFPWPAELSSTERRHLYDAALPDLERALGELDRPHPVRHRVPYAVYRLDPAAVTVLPTPVRAAVAQQLIGPAQAELATRYGSGADGDLDPEPFVAPHGVFLVARRGSEPVGCVGVRTSAPGIGEVKRLYVAPAGRRQGVGTRLLDVALAWAARSGFDSVRLETGTRQPEAIAMYEAQGWQQIPPWSPSVDRGMSVCFTRRCSSG